MKLIPLSKGQNAIVDDEDFEELSAFKWCAGFNRSDRTFRARRSITLSDGRIRAELMSRRLLGLEYGDKRQADHINHNALDNRRCNLRIATRSENQHNRVNQRNSVTGLKGVSWHKASKKWRVQIGIDGVQLYLGCFSKQEDASAAYRNAAKDLHGEFAWL